MNDATKTLKGSAYRDAVKTWHKTLGKGLYACDIDLALICFDGDSVRVILDAKKIGDHNISSTHEQTYDWFIQQGIPVYFITPIDYSEHYCVECGKMDIIIDDDSDVMLTKYTTGKTVTLTRDEYIAWEHSKREEDQ